jgi:hypothetical protein
LVVNVAHRVLSDDQEDEIYRRYAAGEETYLSLASEFFVSSGKIHNVLVAHGWRPSSRSGPRRPYKPAGRVPKAKAGYRVLPGTRLPRDRCASCVFRLKSLDRRRECTVVEGDIEMRGVCGSYSSGRR